MSRRVASAVLGTLSGFACCTPRCQAAWDQAVLAQSGLQLTKSYLVEAAVVIVLFGAAIFAVCRSSRRS